MKLLVQRLNGDIFKLEDYGIKVIDFYAKAPKAAANPEFAEGRHGRIDTGALYDPRELYGEFKLKVVDGIDFVLTRNEIYKIFSSQEEFYIIDLREQGKRWKVRANDYHIQQIMHNRGEFSIDFISNSPFAESVATTLTPFMFDQEAWGIGMGLDEETTNTTGGAVTWADLAGKKWSDI